MTQTRTTISLRAGEALDARTFETVRRTMVLKHHKWDPQVADVRALAPFPLLIDSATGCELSRLAEALAAETYAIEEALLDRPELHKHLGLPRQLRRLFNREEPLTPAAARVMRFDFHPTPDGWRISEVNSDVPGGFTEASAFTRLMSDATGAGSPAGDPMGNYVEALAQAAHAREGVVAFLVAPGFMEDLQIVAGLAHRLRGYGCQTILAHPRDLVWLDGRAFIRQRERIPVSIIVRFYQGEWLARLPRDVNWRALIVGSRTPVANPGVAILSESKRLPLVWEELRVDCPTWRRLLPETRDPRDANWSTDDQWLLKTAYCNTGDDVTIRSLLPRKAWWGRSASARLFPNRWIAQKRFEITPIDSPIGAMFPCIGVYTINGIASGAYARLSRGPIVNYSAVDAALLIARDARDHERKEVEREPAICV